MSYTIGQMMQMRQGLGGLFGQPQMGFDPRMLDPITKSISQYYGQEKMGPFREELMGLIQENFPEFAQGGIMGTINQFQNKPAYTMGGGSFHSDGPSNTGATPLGTPTNSGANNNPFGTSIKPIGLGSLMGNKY
jgi:hypothetical protein